MIRKCPGQIRYGRPRWMLRGLRLAFTAQPELGQPPASFRFIVERAHAVLGADSRDWAALALRTGLAPGLSIREMVRERYRWHHSRSELYRRSGRAAERVAAALTADGVGVPASLANLGPAHPAHISGFSGSSSLR